MTQEVQDGSTIVSTKDSTVWLGRRVRKCKTFGMQHMTVGYVCIYIYIYVEMLVSGVALAIHLFYLLAPLTASLELVVQCI